MSIRLLLVLPAKDLKDGDRVFFEHDELSSSALGQTASAEIGNVFVTGHGRVQFVSAGQTIWLDEDDLVGVWREQ